MSHKNLVGKRIAELRKKNNESQEDLAHAINYNQSTICKLEKGQRLSADQQLKIAEHYGVSPTSLCFFKNFLSASSALLVRSFCSCSNSWL